MTNRTKLLINKLAFFSKYNCLYFTFLGNIFLATTTSYAQKPFITRWKTDNQGTSNKTSITIPTTGGGYKYDVDWNNDGIYDQLGITGSVTHDFGVAGIYTIQIRGSFPRIYFNNKGDSFKLLFVFQWGDIAWKSMEDAFAGCGNLRVMTDITDLPNLSGVKSMARMFLACQALDGPVNIGKWNTAGVIDMQEMFILAYVFNQPIGNWNTSHVTNMRGMFHQTEYFNQPIGNWNTANVTDMSLMFGETGSFNQPIGNWNTAKVTDMSLMFHDAKSFNQPIGNWSTANVTRMDLMFWKASSFNQPIGIWNTSKVINMKGMFDSATEFNQSLGKWSLNPAVDLNNMFDKSGMDCGHYGATLNGWDSNPATPTNRLLGAEGLKYGITGISAHINLDLGKGWTFIGDGATSGNCSASPFEVSALSSRKSQNSETQSEKEIAIYPNPTSNGFYVSGLDKNQNLVIKDAKDKAVHTQLWSPGMAINVDHLADGTYYVSIAGQKMRVVIKKGNP